MLIFACASFANYPSSFFFLQWRGDDWCCTRGVRYTNGSSHVGVPQCKVSLQIRCLGRLGSQALLLVIGLPPGPRLAVLCVLAAVDDELCDERVVAVPAEGATGRLATVQGAGEHRHIHYCCHLQTAKQPARE